jgi:hypothetical protein
MLARRVHRNLSWKEANFSWKFALHQKFLMNITRSLNLIWATFINSLSASVLKQATGKVCTQAKHAWCIPCFFWHFLDLKHSSATVLLVQILKTPVEYLEYLFPGPRWGYLFGYTILRVFLSVDWSVLRAVGWLSIWDYSYYFGITNFKFVSIKCYMT